jgi:hypothetical protein
MAPRDVVVTARHRMLLLPAGLRDTAHTAVAMKRARKGTIQPDVEMRRADWMREHIDCTPHIPPGLVVIQRQARVRLPAPGRCVEARTYASLRAGAVGTGRGAKEAVLLWEVIGGQLLSLHGLRAAQGSADEGPW